MPPLPQSRLPTGRWSMLKRASGTATALLVLAGVALPSALIAGQVSATAVAARPGATGQRATAAQAATAARSARAAHTLAAVRQPGDSPVSVAITSMSPSWAGPRSTIVVTGSLTNVSGQSTSGLTVQLLASANPISSVTELAKNIAQTDNLASTILPNAAWHSTGELAPGASVTWSVKVKANAIGMTVFGVYPLAAQAQNSFGSSLMSTTTYLPYIPPKKGPHRAPRPTPQKIAWVWPFVGQPLLNEPWQANCQGPQAQALARSLAPGGRLGNLLDAASKSGGPTLTWAVDPALLANAHALAGCSAAALRKPAAQWLAAFKQASAHQPLFVLPYADVNVAALLRQRAGGGHVFDVTQAFLDGRPAAGRILGRNIAPTTDDPAGGITWPADGINGLPTVEQLAAVYGVRSVLLSDKAMRSAPSTVVRAVNNQGGYATLLLANQSLTSALGPAANV